LVQPLHRPTMITSGRALCAALLVVAITGALGVEPSVAPATNAIAVTEKTLVGEVLDMLWVGPDEKIVYILTDKNKLYRSADEGKTWVDQMPRMKRSDSTGGVVSMELSAHSKNHMVFLSDDRVHWATSNAGRSYTVISDVHRFHEVKLHPKHEKMMLTCVLSDKCHDSSESGFCFKKMYMSEDFGITWKFLADYIVQFDWAHNLQRGQADHLPKHAILASQFKTKTGDQRFGFWDRDIDFIVSNDFWASSPTILVERGNRFLFTAKFLFVAKVHSSLDNQVTLQMSSDGGKSWNTATLPFGDLHQHSYTILDTSEDSVFLHVNHIGEKSTWGNVYISNADGLGYALSLPHNRRATNGKCDFEKVEGMKGIYLANYIDNAEQLERAKGGGNEMGISSTRSSSAAISARGAAQEEQVRTVVTFDKGAVWSYLRPPTRNAAGNPIMCATNDCSLHLHGITSEWGPFYTTETAIGLIMATGNVGEKLSFYADDINTYFSRDAGLSWFEVAHGSHIYEFGDHGALIVMANDQQATTVLKYSWNEGISWEEFTFTDKPVEVVNIIIEPTATSQNFVLYGARWLDNGKVEGVVVHLDFAELHQRACVGAKEPGTEESDFEKWTPHDGRTGDQCLLGHQMWYARRKRDASCFNGDKMERQHEVSKCDCDELDWECDVGYARHIDGGPCVAQQPLNMSLLVPTPCPSGTSYFITNGYRKVVGDMCQKGINHAATEFQCPSWAGSVSSAGWVVMLLIVVLVAGLGYINFSGKNSNNSRYSHSSSFDTDGVLQTAKNFLFQGYETVRRAVGGRPSGYSAGGFGSGDSAAHGYVQYNGISEREPDSAIDDMDNMAGSGDFGGDAFGSDDDEDDDESPQLLDRHAINKAIKTRTHDDVDIDAIPVLKGPADDEV